MYNKILVPLDGSELAECTLEHLKEVATGCKIPEAIILHVLEPINPQVYTALAQAGSATVDKFEKERRQDAENYISKTIGMVRQDNINAVPALAFGDAATEIIKYAKDNNVDLILMSTHGRSGITRFFMGSVASRVVNHSTVPVFIIPPAGCRVLSGS